MDGLIKLDDVTRAAGKLDGAAFREAWSVPVLLLAVFGTLGVEGDNSKTAEIDLEDVGLLPKEPVLPDMLARLEKSDRNNFPHIIPAGRAPSKDICLPLPSVSKTHAFFMHVGDSWQVNHNGRPERLLVDGLALEPGRAAPLRDGSRLWLGPQIEATFVLPSSLGSRLQALTAS